MARPRTGDKDQALVNAAVELFLTQGVKGTTVKDIAVKANVSVGTVYLYYKNKKDIVRRVAYAFAEEHKSFAKGVLGSKKKPINQLNDYILGFYDMWQPFGKNTRGPIELAEAVLRFAPETPAIAQKEFQGTIAQILASAKAEGMRVQNPQKEAHWISLATMAFFPLAGTPEVKPLMPSIERGELEGLLKWICQKLQPGT